jgi:hypothetical protein
VYGWPAVSDADANSDARPSARQVKYILSVFKVDRSDGAEFAKRRSCLLSSSA